MKISQPCLRGNPLSGVTDKRKARALATHQLIQDVAERIVLAESLAHISTKRLVEEAGVSERTIFNHFSNISDILLNRLGEHLAGVIDVESFPTDLSLKALPGACPAFIREQLFEDSATQSLERFVLLAARMGEAEDWKEMLGKEIFETLQLMSRRLVAAIQQGYSQLSEENLIQLSLYIYNLLTSLIFGMGRYISRNPHLVQSPQEYSIEELRQSMAWGLEQVSQGVPTLQGRFE